MGNEETGRHRECSVWMGQEERIRDREEAKMWELLTRPKAQLLILAHTERNDALLFLHGLYEIKQHERRTIHPHCWDNWVISDWMTERCADLWLSAHGEHHKTTSWLLCCQNQLRLSHPNSTHANQRLTPHTHIPKQCLGSVSLPAFTHFHKHTHSICTYLLHRNW